MKRQVCNTCQSNLDLSQYWDNFTTNDTITDQMVCGIWVDRTTVEKDLQSAHGSTITMVTLIHQASAMEKAKTEYHGVAFLVGSSNQCNPLRANS